MKVFNIQPINIRNNYSKQQSNINLKNTPEQKEASLPPKALMPIAYHNINFKSTDPNRLVMDMEFENYKYVNAYTKRRYRKLYENFATNRYIDKSLLFDPKRTILPLTSEETMNDFIEISRKYLKYKDQPIICLGRSPKWFLNAAQWMKDGIQPYKFVAFSKYWYRPDPIEGAVKISKAVPSETEITAYRKYLNRIKADPKTIVERFEKTGKRTVITDYICSGKGVCSFLDIMGNYAKDLGILEKFSKAIQIVGIGSIAYMEDLNPYADSISIPSAPMPEVLQPYGHNINQDFYDMPYRVFDEMLLNQNTNECRSTYFPHEAWTVYKPDQFKIGMIKDMKKVQKLVKTLKGEKKYASIFTAAMQDFRNLLNFRILDALEARKLLKASHVTKI